MFADGWDVGIVNLRLVIAAQPNVCTDHAAERAKGITAGNPLGVASVTLPLPNSAALPSQFDETRQTWMIAAADPNPRIIGHFGGPVAPDVVGFGFAVARVPSFLQIGVTSGRPVLRDGYHRAYGLLRAGITHATAFVKDFGPFGDIGLPLGMLSSARYLGDRPPLLVDYDDPITSASGRQRRRRCSAVIVTFVSHLKLRGTHPADMTVTSCRIGEALDVIRQVS